ncbi:RGCVC family protein [Pseudonocardia xishanensis]|uniref:Uncharacterized protein n=1 Tax=Pseudonocardia xishanensis TaxID=630995 RepID=A0ABP8RH77_9PSEU
MNGRTDTATGSVESAESVEVESCRACPHPVADHSTLDLRFCAATVSMSRDRGCICGPVTGRATAPRARLG